MSVLTVTTHLVAFFLGGVTVRVLTLHFVRVREVDGHPALEITKGEPHMDKPRRRLARLWTALTAGPWAIIAVASLVVVGIGAQGYLAAEDNEDRDRADRAYADCLTTFATDLVETIEARSEAGRRLDLAKEAKDAATDRVIEVVALARRVPPEASEDDFDRALAAQVKTQRKFNKVKRETANVLKRNQYVAPSAVCQR